MSPPPVCVFESSYKCWKCRHGEPPFEMEAGIIHFSMEAFRLHNLHRRLFYLLRMSSSFCVSFSVSLCSRLSPCLSFTCPAAQGGVGGTGEGIGGGQRAAATSTVRVGRARDARLNLAARWARPRRLRWAVGVDGVSRSGGDCYAVRPAMTPTPIARASILQTDCEGAFSIRFGLRVG